MTWLTRVGDWIHHLFTDDVAPALESFLKQFTTDMGKAALADGAVFAADVMAGGNRRDAGNALLSKLETQGINIATKDAFDVAMNAISVHMAKMQAEEQAKNPLSKPPADTPEPASEASTA